MNNGTTTLPAGTKVLNTTDGEPGTILNGYAYAGGTWTEYEVETAHHIEIWKTSEMVRMSEIQISD